jgi:hypothetical protein
VTTTTLPSRGDEFAAWLRAQRDALPVSTIAHNVVDELLDTYRLHADTRTPLDRHACQGGTPDDCYVCYEETQKPAAADGESITDEQMAGLRIVAKMIPGSPLAALVAEVDRLTAENTTLRGHAQFASRSIGGVL